MKPISSLFSTITTAMLSIHEGIEERAGAFEARLVAFSCQQSPSMVKTAFDTRRINQETDFNPRRNLQHYQRSEPFISKGTSDKLIVFHKLKATVDELKSDFIGDPDWLDSKMRVLSNALDRTLRTEQKDMDYSQSNMDYLSEMLYLRYRLNDDNISKMSNVEIKDIILAKDERLFLKHARGEIQKPDKLTKNNTGKSVLSSESSDDTSGKKTVNLTINM